MPLVRTAVISLALVCGLVAPAVAQVSAPSSADVQERRLTAAKLGKVITIELVDARLEDVIQFVADFAAITIEAQWLDDDAGGQGGGLDKDQRITIAVKDVTVLTFIERVLQKARTDFSPATWQFAPDGGSIEVGPRSRLNRHAYLKLYDIQDLLFVIPDFVDAPQLDLDQVLNQGGQGGGGGGGGVFGDEGDQDPNNIPESELADRIIDIITTSVETDQWQDNGGDGGSIRFHNGYLLVRAPDYIHRHLEGYPFDLGRPTRRAVESASTPPKPAKAP